MMPNRKKRNLPATEGSPEYWTAENLFLHGQNDPIDKPQLIDSLLTGKGNDVILGIMAMSMSRWADRHLGMSEDGIYFRGKSIDLMCRIPANPSFVEKYAHAWDEIVEDANLWITTLYPKKKKT